jgi:hypothetical protein
MSGLGTGKGTRYSKILSINSNDRQPGAAGDRSSNFQINIGQNLQRCVGISYKSCNFFNNFYNVRGPVSYNLSYNNQFSFIFHHGIDYITVLTVPPGYYSATGLMQQMITQMQAALAALGFGATFSFTLSPTTGLMTLNVTGTGTVNDTFGVQNQDTTGLGNHGYNPWELLGFLTPFTLAAPGNTLSLPTTITASQMPSLGGITQINIESHALAPSNCYRELGQISDWFQIIPVTAPFQGFNADICRVDDLCEISYDRPRILNVIDIVLRDHDGYEVNLNGSPFNLDIRAYYNDIV